MGQGNDFISDFENASSLGKISIIPEFDINYEALKTKYSFKKIFGDFYKREDGLIKI